MISPVRFVLLLLAGAMMPAVQIVLAQPLPPPVAPSGLPPPGVAPAQPAPAQAAPVAPSPGAPNPALPKPVPPANSPPGVALVPAPAAARPATNPAANPAANPAPANPPPATAAAQPAPAAPRPAPAAPKPAPAHGLSPADLAFIDRVTWGANESTAAEFVALGRDRWLDKQLHPGKDRLPAAAQDQINALPIAAKPLTEIVFPLTAQQRNASQIPDPEQKKILQQAHQQAMNELGRQAQTRSILRDLYSEDQLREKMTWFWFNHFNVHLGKGRIRETIGDYEEHLRQHALGHFRELLRATATHPAMLQYLDNEQNAKGHVNENYAREIMELHTMGVGSGYSQGDVQELAKILTGVGINFQPIDPNVPKPPHPDHVRNGLFEFYPNRHDYGEKHLLGHTVGGRGFAEVDEALDIIARHPATATHVSRQMATYFFSDNPPDALVQRMAEKFRATDGDIAAVLAVMFRSPEFNGPLPVKYKDPMQFVLSAVRLAYDTKVVLNAQPVIGWMNRLGEGLYNHQTPDGYPMVAAAWNAPGQMQLRFEIARAIGSNAAGLFKAPVPEAVERPAFPQIANAFYFTTLRPTLREPTRQALDQAVSPQEWNTLFLSSPEFNGAQ
jgi:uncharacterized protein (DUF1800 family)